MNIPCIWKARNGNLWIKGKVVGQKKMPKIYQVECDGKVYSIPKENVIFDVENRK